MKLSKQVTKAGGITVPRIIRDTLNIPKGATVDLETTEDGALTIRKHVPTCMVCGTADHVCKLNDVEVCETHLKEMLEKQADGESHV